MFLIARSGYAQLLHESNTDQTWNENQKNYYFYFTDSLTKETLPHSCIKPLYEDEKISSKYKSIISNREKHIFYWYENAEMHFSKEVTADPWIDTKFISFLSSNKRFYCGSAGIAFNKSKIKLFRSRYGIGFVYLYNQSTFPDYIQSHIAQTHVVPGQGYAHSADWGYRYQDISFYAAKSAGKHFVFEAGYGKHFFGDGYRSLFLSDAACSYPYFKIVTTAWKMKYVNIWANFKDITEGYDNWFNAKNKFGAFHFLSWNATKRLSLNFFEAIIWAGKTEHHSRGFDVNYLNPVIFYRPIEFSLGSPDNALLGAGAHYKIGTKHVVYAQIMLDDFLMKEVRAGFVHYLKPHDSTLQYGSWFNKQAWQLGYKYFDVAGIKYLNFQTEFNYVRPYTYSHREVIENYGHFNEPLAHPLGSNFWESVSFLRYTKDKWYFETEFLHYVTGLDSNGTHFGQDIFKPTFDTYEPGVGNIVVKQYGNKVGQGIKNTVNYISLKTSYLIYSPLNLRIEAGFIHRTQNSALENKATNYLFFGIKTSLDNFYYDF